MQQPDTQLRKHESICIYTMYHIYLHLPNVSLIKLCITAGILTDDVHFEHVTLLSAMVLQTGRMSGKSHAPAYTEVRVSDGV